MGLFFVIVGMQLEFIVLWNSLFEIVFGVFVLMIVKVILVRGVFLLVKIDVIDGWFVGVKFCQIGEFSFVIVVFVMIYGVLMLEQLLLIVCMGVISMVLILWFMNNSVIIVRCIVNKDILFDDNVSFGNVELLINYVIICGFGCVGQLVVCMLKMEGIYFVVIDMDFVRVYES